MRKNLNTTTLKNNGWYELNARRRTILGFCFRPRLVQNFRDKTLVGSFNRAVSPSAMKAKAGSDSGHETLASNACPEL